jgi:acyl carrier protein
MEENELERTQQQIIEICRTRVPAGVSIGPETSLIRDLGLDSLQAVEVISDIESGLEVSIPSEVLPEIDTLADVAKLVVDIKSRKLLS